MVQHVAMGMLTGVETAVTAMSIKSAIGYVARANHCWGCGVSVSMTAGDKMSKLIMAEDVARRACGALWKGLWAGTGDPCTKREKSCRRIVSSCCQALEWGGSAIITLLYVKSIAGLGK